GTGTCAIGRNPGAVCTSDCNCTGGGTCANAGGCVQGTVCSDGSTCAPIDVTLCNYSSYFGVCGDGVSPIIFDTNGTIVDDLFGSGASNSVIAAAQPDCLDYAGATI